MKFAVIVIVAAIGIVIFVKGKRSQQTVSGPGKGSAAGWIVCATPKGADSKKVLIVAPPKCPRAEGRRAVALGQQLAGRQIPCIQTDSVNFTVTSEGEAQEIDNLMKQGAPMVFLNNKAKSNPALEEVIAEYQSMSP
jgi:hypothetical protein